MARMQRMHRECRHHHNRHNCSQVDYHLEDTQHAHEIVSKKMDRYAPTSIKFSGGGG